jgi:hypothetical protein
VLAREALARELEAGHGGVLEVGLPKEARGRDDREPRRDIVPPHRRERIPFADALGNRSTIAGVAPA